MSLQTFNEEVAPLKDKLYRFSLRIVKDSKEAEDVVQDIMVKVWNKRAEWDQWHSLEAMCMTMTPKLIHRPDAEQAPKGIRDSRKLRSGLRRAQP